MLPLVIIGIWQCGEGEAVRGVHIETSVFECFDVLSATWMEARQLIQYLPDGLTVVECFDVLSATWMEVRQLSQYLPDGLHGMAVACDEERAYTLGGYDRVRTYQ